MKSSYSNTSGNVLKKVQLRTNPIMYVEYSGGIWYGYNQPENGIELVSNIQLDEIERYASEHHYEIQYI